MLKSESIDWFLEGLKSEVKLRQAFCYRPAPFLRSVALIALRHSSVLECEHPLRSLSAAAIGISIRESHRARRSRKHSGASATFSNGRDSKDDVNAPVGVVMPIWNWLERLTELSGSFLPPDYSRAVLAVLCGFVIHVAVLRTCRHLLRRAEWDGKTTYLLQLTRATRILLPLIALHFASPQLLPGETATLSKRLLTLAVIAGVVYSLLLSIATLQRYVEQAFSIDVEDNFAARRLHTQVTVLKRVVSTVVILVAVALGLMTIPSVRNLGASLLASAGFAGLVIGLAARPMLENLIAGVQIALTQPISIDDVVIVDGEWGWIEEISTTYVVVRVWDDRRLIVPFSKFLQETFQNWTRRTARILGSVFLHVDYSFPVQVLRDELERVVQACDKWDRRVCVLQVTDATAQTIELRALVSAKNSPTCWDLRVHVREKLIEFLQREYPDCLPRARVQLHDPNAGGPSDVKNERSQLRFDQASIGRVSKRA